MTKAELKQELQAKEEEIDILTEEIISLKYQLEKAKEQHFKPEDKKDESN